jgi:Tfp pilus assembly protein PilZ
MMTTNNYLDLLDLSRAVLYNSIYMTIEFVDKEGGIFTVDDKVHKIGKEFSRALSKMCRKESGKQLYYIESHLVRIYLEMVLVQERQRKLRLLITK